MSDMSTPAYELGYLLATRGVLASEEIHHLEAELLPPIALLAHHGFEVVGTFDNGWECFIHQVRLFWLIS